MPGDEAPLPAAEPVDFVDNPGDNPGDNAAEAVDNPVEDEKSRSDPAAFDGGSRSEVAAFDEKGGHFSHERRPLFAEKAVKNDRPFHHVPPSPTLPSSTDHAHDRGHPPEVEVPPHLVLAPERRTRQRPPPRTAPEPRWRQPPLNAFVAGGADGEARGSPAAVTDSTGGPGDDEAKAGER
jgi:hypothetical protein